MPKKSHQAIGDCQLESIVKHIENKKPAINDEVIGFVFPLYYSGLPKIVYDFIKKTNFDKAKYIFAIINCGIPLTSTATSSISKLLKLKGKILNASFCIQMVDNYLLNFEMPPTIEYQKKFENDFEIKLGDIKETINKRLDKKIFELSFLSGLFSTPFLKKVNLMDKNLYYTPQCNCCGICEKVCPVNNIKMVNKKPQWKNNCQLCIFAQSTRYSIKIKLKKENTDTTTEM